MCGIISAFDFSGKPVNDIIRIQFENQKSRGIQGFGLFDYDHKNLVREPGQERIMNWLDKYPSSNILFHHRFPTSTENIRRACHPFSTKDFFKTNYVLVHNGMIRNDDELKKAHNEMGITYTSEHPDGSYNDSEALLWDVALYLEGKQTELKATGSIAFVCMALRPGRKHDRMYFARNNNPLNMLLLDTGIMLSSEGDGEAIKPQTLYCFDYVTKRLSSKELEINSWTSYTYPATYYAEDEDEDWNYAPTGKTSQGYIDAMEEYSSLENEVERILIVEGRDNESDINQAFDRYMWANEGVYSKALEEIEEDTDILYAWQILHPNDDYGVSYSISVLEEAGQRISVDPGYKTFSSVCETYVWRRYSAHTPAERYPSDRSDVTKQVNLALKAQGEQR